MPSYQTLKLTGDFDLQVEIEFEEIQRYYGSGYDTTVRTGHSAGVRCDWSFKRRVVSCPGSLLPDKAPDTAADDISNPPAPLRGD